MKTVTQLKAGIAGILTGTNLDSVTNANGAIERAASNLALRAYIPEGSGRQSLMLYDGVYDYSAPAAIFGGALTDLRPQGVTRNPWDYVYRQPVELFDRTKSLLPNGYQVTFEYNAGNPIMRVAQHRAQGKIMLDPMNSLTGWASAGTAGTIALDSTVYYQAPASLRFNVTVGSGYIEKTLTTPISALTYDGVGVVFVAIDTPSAANLASMSIRIGTSSSVYTTVSATQGFLGAWPAGQWTLVAFDLSQGIKLGSPNFAALTYLRVTCTAITGTLTNMRVGQMFMSLPSPHELLYQSTAIFSVAGVLSSSITADTDSIILQLDAYTILEQEAAYEIAFQNGGTIGSGILKTIDEKLFGTRGKGGAQIKMGLYDFYRTKHPSEELEVIDNYYD